MTLNKLPKWRDAMVTEYGMSEKLGPVQYEGNHAMFGAQSPQK